MSDEVKNNSNLKEAIIKVIAFFDMFDYPLTSNEILFNLSLKCELNEVMAALENMAWKFPVPAYIKGGKIEHKNGFYFLTGRGSIVEERLKRYGFTDRKLKRALLIVKIFRFIPWIKMIAVGNLLGAHNLKDSSDIDFFIVAEAKRIWLVRFFCASIAKILGLRPQANNSRDKICLSFYASEKAMDLSGLMLKDVIKDVGSPIGRPTSNTSDIYFIYWLAGLISLYDVGGIYEKFITANFWLGNFLPNWQPVNPAKQRLVKPLERGFYNDLIDLFFGGLEPQFKAWQLKILPLELKNIMNLDSRVVVNDKIIKLHANDRRSEYKSKYNEKIKKYEFSK